MRLEFGPGVRALLVAAAAIPQMGCYSPHLVDCALRCGDQNACPDGLACGADGWCRPAGSAGICDTPSPDAPVGPAACDLISQDSCDAGRACDVDADGVRYCRDITQAQPRGALCQDATQCALSLTCVDDTCHAFCETDAICAGAGSLCEPEVADTRVCTTSCDPITEMGCLVGFSCAIGYEGSGGGRAFTDCRAAGDRKENTPCADTDPCQRGLGCVDGICVVYCRRGGMNKCSNGRDCLPLAASPVRIGATEFGYCQPK